MLSGCITTVPSQASLLCTQGLVEEAVRLFVLEADQQDPGTMHSPCKYGTIETKRNTLSSPITSLKGPGEEHEDEVCFGTNCLSV